MAGSRVAPSEGSAFTNKGPFIFGGIVLVLIVLYLGLCVWVMGQDTMLPGVTVGGVDVGGMTASQAEETLNGQLQLALAAQPVTVEYGTTTKVADATWFQIETAFTQQYLDQGRDNFFTSGANYLTQVMGGSTQSDVAICFAAGVDGALDTLTNVDSWNIPSAAVDASYEVVEEGLVLTRGVSGATIDGELLKEQLQQGAYGALCLYTGTTSDYPTQLTLSIVESQGEELDIQSIHQALSGEASDAYMDEDYNIVPHVMGADFDLDETQAIYDSLGEGESATILIEEVGDVLTTQEFEALLFADELTTSTSYVSGTTDRRTNVKVAAGLTDGTIILPGETFSYSAVLQNCDISLGFQIGTGYVNGESVDVTGGGVCQVSSTLYYGLLSTSLQVDERRNHSYVPGYVPNGMDATYYGGVTDFKFTNNTEFPIKITTEYTSGNYLTTTVLGTETDTNIYVPRSSSSDYKTLDPVYKADSSVAQGKIVTMQTAYTGCITAVYRDVYDANMNFLYSEYMHTDYYSARSATYYYNPVDATALGIPSDYVNYNTAVMVPVTVPSSVPAVTETPTETETPTVEETPVETETPTVTETPAETETPTVEETPAETEAPVVEETPAEVETATVEESPLATVEATATQLTGLLQNAG